jgi:hypothetical protein
LSFDSDSKLALIESEAFHGCIALKSICLPPSIRSLAKNGWRESSSVQLSFDSGLSLLKMIEADEVDLAGAFDIYVNEFGDIVSFPGYSVCVLPAHDTSIRLMKNLYHDDELSGCLRLSQVSIFEA